MSIVYANIDSILSEESKIYRARAMHMSYVQDVIQFVYFFNLNLAS